MNAILMNALAAVGFLGFFSNSAMPQDAGRIADDCCTKKSDACCAKADENCTWSLALEGKRTVRKYHCSEDAKARMPNTVRIEVKAEDRQAGDTQGMKLVGKRTERVFFRDVERKAETANADCSGSKDSCNYTFVTVGKHTERRTFCEHNDVRMMCGEKAGECSGCRK